MCSTGAGGKEENHLQASDTCTANLHQIHLCYGEKTRPWFGQCLGCSSFRGPSFSHTLFQPAECVCGNVCGKRSTRWRKQRTTRAAGSFEHDTSWYSFGYGAKLETSGCSKRMSSVQSLWNSPCVVLTEHRLYHPIRGYFQREVSCPECLLPYGELYIFELLHPQSNKSISGWDMAAIFFVFLCPSGDSSYAYYKCYFDSYPFYVYVVS